MSCLHEILHMKLGALNRSRSLALLAPLHLALWAAVWLAPGLSPAAPNQNAPGLVWDADQKDCHVESGATKASFQFWFTNTTSEEILIQSAKSSCFCTVAKLPSEPWPIPAGMNGSIDVTMDLTGKRGNVTKPVNVATSAGTKTLLVRVNIPYDPVATPPAFAVSAPAGSSDEQRQKNLEMALADRQVVFKKAECAECHVKPVLGTAGGAEIYAGACAVCHDSSHRASTVPDLKVKGAGQNLEYWREWIGHGRAGTMMPAFAKSEGGPLSEAQLESLAEYLAMSIDAPVSDTPKAGAKITALPTFGPAEFSSLLRGTQAR